MVVIATVAGLLLALFLGTHVGDVKTFAIIAAVLVGVGILAALKTRVWVLIPVCWYLTGSINMLPLPFSVQELAVLSVAVMMMVFYALKRLRFQPRPNPIDFLVWLNMGYLLSVYIRNPVGVAAVGSEMVGGRPYLVVFVGFLAFLVLCRVLIPLKWAYRFPLFIAIPSILANAFAMVTYFFPGLVPIVLPFYSGVDYGGVIEGRMDSGAPHGPNRVMRATDAGLMILRLLCSYFRPLSCLIPSVPWRFVLCWVGLAMMLAGGFRNAVVATVAMFAISTLLRRKGRDLVTFTFFGIAFLVLLIVGQGNLFKLPGSAQRALSFLPADWDYDVVSDAEGSAEWRFHIWETVWKNNSFIKNKILGDGFGFSAYELRIQMSALTGGLGYIGGESGEAQMVTGAYHSGPLSAIRFVGVVGFLFYMILVTYLAYYAWKLVGKARETPLFPLAIFIAIPVIYKPFDYVFIFGGFDSSMPETLFYAGMLKLVTNSLATYRAEEKQRHAVAKLVMPEIAPGTRLEEVKPFAIR